MRCGTVNRTRLFAVAVIVTVVSGLLVQVPSGADTPAPRWAVVQSDSPFFQQISDMTCLGSTTCFAIAENQASQGLVIGTTDGGTEWTERYLPSVGAVVDDLSCTSAADCAASIEGRSSSKVAFTADGGAHWSVRTLPGVGAGLGGVSCLSASTCDVVVQPNSTATTFTTTNDGSTWSAKRGTMEFGLATMRDTQGVHHWR